MSFPNHEVTLQLINPQAGEHDVDLPVMKTSAHRPVRAGLPPLPLRITTLPVDERGFPVPRFVAWIDGKPDFRVVDPRQRARAVRLNRCWICGEAFGAHKAFVVGPMCVVNRVSSEPPSHRECAVFAAQACPFLTLPRARRRDANLPATGEPPGVMLTRNPGVTPSGSRSPTARCRSIMACCSAWETPSPSNGSRRAVTRAATKCSIRSGPVCPHCRTWRTPKAPAMNWRA